MSSTNKNASQNDMMAQQMKMMNKTMPLMSLFFCFTLPVGLGIYWTVSAAYRCLQQVTINKIISNMSLDDIIEKNKEKAQKKQEKRGIYQNQIRESAALKTRTIESKANIKNYADNNENAYTNNIECFWGILKRGILGIYHFTSKKHLQIYIDEFVFRYNTRYMTEQNKFETLLSNMTVRTKYKELINA